MADYIDLLLSEADAELKQQWTDGLAAVDAEATTRFSAPVAKLTPAQVDDAAHRDQQERARAADAGRALLHDDEAGDDPRLLHVRDRHPQGPALQGQSVSAGVPRLPDRGRQGLPALRTEGHPQDQQRRGGAVSRQQSRSGRFDDAVRAHRHHRRHERSDADARSLRDHQRIAQALHVDHAEIRQMGRDRRRLRRGRRHGRVPARDGRHQGAAARSGPHDRRAEGIPDDGVAVSVDAASSHADRRTAAERRGIQLRQPSVRQRSEVREIQEADVVRGQFLHPQLGGEREGAPDDRHALRLGARARARRQDELLGPRRAALRADAVQGGEPRRLRRRLADRLQRRRAVLRQGRRAARLLGHEGRPRSGAGRHLPAADQAQLRRGVVQARDREDGPALHSGPRRRHHRRRAEQQVPHALHGARPLRPRLRSAGRLPFADGADLSGAGYGQRHRAAVFGRIGSAARREHQQGRAASA